MDLHRGHTNFRRVGGLVANEIAKVDLRLHVAAGGVQRPAEHRPASHRHEHPVPGHLPAPDLPRARRPRPSQPRPQVRTASPHHCLVLPLVL